MAVAALVVATAVLAAVPTPAVDPAVTTVYDVRRPLGVMVTSGGWAYCQQLRRLARNTRYTLLCGRYWKDGYLGPTLRARRHLDWGNARYLASLARRVKATHARVGGRLIFVGVSYSGFGVSTLATHHPELRPNRLIVVDSYFDLVARRRHIVGRSPTAIEIDRETGGSAAALRRRSASVAGLARLVRSGTRLTVIWTVSEHEQRLFNGATCDETASAGTLAQLARVLRRPIPGWVTHARHGRNLWNHGISIIRGRNPGRRMLFRADGRIPPGATC